MKDYSVLLYLQFTLPLGLDLSHRFLEDILEFGKGLIRLSELLIHKTVTQEQFFSEFALPMKQPKQYVML